MNSDGILNKLFQTFNNNPFLKKLLIIVAAILLLVFIFYLILFSKNSSNILQNPIDKTWEIILKFDTNSDKLSFKKLNILNNKIKQDSRGAEFSPYELVMYNVNDEAIYKTKINIMTTLLYDMSVDAPITGKIDFSLPKNLETVLYVPFLDKGKTIIIKKDNEQILKINLPEQIGFNFPGLAKAYALGGSVPCSPLVVTFISDGYTDFGQFRKDVDQFKQIYLSTEPFASANIFDFRIIENSEPLGCKSAGNLDCLGNSAIMQKAIIANPDTSKVIVLVNMQIPLAEKQGVASGIGGDRAAFSNNGGNIIDATKTVAIHEFLGHLVSKLYDRYVVNPDYRDSTGNFPFKDYGLIKSGDVKSNCTDNSGGESWWQAAGSTEISPGCASEKNWAPTKNTCTFTNSALLEAGNPTSVMSAVGCSKTLSFDSIEQAWIKADILPFYCRESSTTTTTLVSGGVTTSTTTIPSETPLLKGTVYTDLNGNNKFDSGEPGYQGAVVTISGPFNGSKTTDNSGKFSFPLLPVGSYTISFVAGPTNSNQSPPFSIAEDMTVTTDFGILPDSKINTSPFTRGTSTTTTTIYQTANCTFDPNCGTGGDKNGIQVCALNCTIINK
jgi:hypothetical protein